MYLLSIIYINIQIGSHVTEALSAHGDVNEFVWICISG